MNAAVELKTVLAYVTGIIILFFLGRVLFNPMKIITKIIYNTILGGIALFVINLIGKPIGFSIAYNAATIIVTGFLGIPGVILLVILKQIFRA